MPFEVEQSVEIDAPVKEVWDHVSSHDEWRRPVVEEARKVSEGPPGPGTRYEDEVEAMGMTGVVPMELTEWDPPQGMAWYQPERSGPTLVEEGRYELEELPDGGTRFTLYNRYRTVGFWKLLTPLIERKIRDDFYPTLLSNLQAAVEEDG